MSMTKTTPAGQKPRIGFDNGGFGPMSQAANAGILQHGERRDAVMGAPHDQNDRLQPTPVGADDPWLMCRRSLPVAASAERADRWDLQRSAEHRMAGMRMAFIASGGLRSVGELTRGKDKHSRTRFAQIARWIATREIIGFMWQAEPWVPMFQFDAGAQLHPRHALQPLFALLVPLYDAWEMANWFAGPNHWLSGHRPVDDCADCLPAVLDVAHLEHFIASGKTQPQDPVASPSNACTIAS